MSSHKRASSGESLGRSPSKSSKRMMTTLPGTVTPEELRRKVVFPCTSVGFLGAPLVDGQNLEGADLAPIAMRDAGVKILVEKLGFHWQDHGDIDFSKKYAELGLQRYQKKNSQAHWRQWMDSGAHESFAEWAKKNIQTPKRPSGAHSPRSSQNNGVRGDPYDEIVNANLIGAALEEVYKRSLDIMKKSNQFLLTVGGDHSIATSTIAAVSAVHNDLSVIWIDAHGDANTPETSPSLHYHGMPVAHLLGWFKRHPKGFEWMQQRGKKCIDEAHFAYIGLRDIDKEEGDLLRNSDMHIYTMRDVDRLGIARVMEDAISKVDPNGKRPIHLSLDVDGIDPSVAPGTGTCARGGLTYREIHYVCEELALTRRLVSMDLVEINPGIDTAPGEKLHGDQEGMARTTPTVQLGVELVLSALGKAIM